METTLSKPISTEPVHVLLVGNNPIELTSMLDKVNHIPDVKIISEFAFDVKSIVERLIRFTPHYILIDDNIGKQELTQTVEALAHNQKTKDVPITVIKNSNYAEALPCSEVMDYILKKQFTSELLYTALKNSFKFRRTRAYLAQAYEKRKGQLLRLMQ